MLVYLITHFVYFTAIWYIFWSFGVFYIWSFGIIFSLWYVVGTKKHLAKYLARM
jgi:hypothetical protein